jgi:hypothetical protein
MSIRIGFAIFLEHRVLFIPFLRLASHVMRPRLPHSFLGTVGRVRRPRGCWHLLIVGWVLLLEVPDVVDETLIRLQNVRELIEGHVSDGFSHRLHEALVVHSKENLLPNQLPYLSSLVLARSTHCKINHFGPPLIVLDLVLTIAALMTVTRLYAAMRIRTPYIGLAWSILLIVIISWPALRQRHILLSPVMILVTSRVEDDITYFAAQVVPGRCLRVIRDDDVLSVQEDLKFKFIEYFSLPCPIT